MRVETYLRLFRDGAEIRLPFGSALPLSQTLEPIGTASQLRRDVNGVLRSSHDAAFRKYSSSISGDAHVPASLGDLWPGDLLTVHCAATLRQPMLGATSVILGRDAVPDSVIVYDALTRPVSHTISGRTVSADGGEHVCYKPVLTMRVASLSQSQVDRRGQCEWSLNMEEV